MPTNTQQHLQESKRKADRITLKFCFVYVIMCIVVYVSCQGTAEKQYFYTE